MHSNLTVVFPVKDESKNLRRAIPLVDGLGSVLVVDSASGDDTVTVAKELGADVLQFDWNGEFPKKRNWVLQNYAFQSEWVLFLDADEFVSEEFVGEVKRAINETSHVGFWLNFKIYFMGRPLKYGDSMKKLALFRIGAGEYERIDEDNWSHLDMEVHEHPVLKGSIGEIFIPIEHNDFRGLKHYIAKHNEYSSWEAARYIRLTEKSNTSHAAGEWSQLTDRQKKKYNNLAKWWLAPAYFLVTYFLKRGFLDGAIGLHFALQKAIYFYQIRIKIREKLRASNQQ
ncbi:MAG: glycosyltransferase family 2 protein [Verrucomicrobiota bacterium]